MKPIKNKSTNCTYAENQPEYLPLPAEKTPDGMITTSWKLSFAERVLVLLFGKMFISIMTFNKPLQPIKPFVKKGKKEKE